MPSRLQHWYSVGVNTPNLRPSGRNALSLPLSRHALQGFYSKALSTLVSMMLNVVMNEYIQLVSWKSHQWGAHAYAWNQPTDSHWQLIRIFSPVYDLCSILQGYNSSRHCWSSLVTQPKMLLLLVLKPKPGAAPKCRRDHIRSPLSAASLRHVLYSTS